MWDDKWTGKTIGMALDEAARQYGDRVATVFHNGAVTYNQLKQPADHTSLQPNSDSTPKMYAIFGK